MDIVILGLSITSSWGNGHATTFRGLMRELDALGQRVTFLERDVPWYAAHRDLPQPPYGRTYLYTDLTDLRQRFSQTVAQADAVIVGSYVPEGVAVGEWVQDTARGITGFYDIDTPVTLAKLAVGDYEYLHPRLIPGYTLYLSFTGGPLLQRLEREFGANDACALYCAFDPAEYFPEARPPVWDLGYLGTYSDDRQPRVEQLLLAPAQCWQEGRFVLAGPMYPPHLAWPTNLQRYDHVPPAQHRRFYNQQRFTLNITRDAMLQAGWSPSVRLFEAAACAVPIISDVWTGLEALFEPGVEILLAQTAAQVLDYLQGMTEAERLVLGQGARARVMAEHTAAHRATQLIRLLSGRHEPRHPAPLRL